MIRRLALTASFAVLGAVAVAPKAQAQAAAPATETIQFNGAIGSVCTFKNTTAGVLVDLAGIDLTTAPDEGGTEGETTVNCTSSSNSITVSEPRQIQAPPDFVERVGRSVSEVSYNGQSAQSLSASGPATSLQVPAGDSTLKVSVFVRTEDDNVPPGIYQYEVDVTATPN